MLSLQIAISNLTSTNYQDEPPQELTLHFGPIATTLPLLGGNGGKCLFLALSPQKLHEIYLNFACGLFLQTPQGKYFSLLSLQQLSPGHQLLCEPVTLCNDLREVKYTCEFSFVPTEYKEPRVADTGKSKQREAVVQAMKKPPVPKVANFVREEKPVSFLYGNGGKTTDHLQTLKQGLRKQSEISKQLTQSKNKVKMVPKAAMAKLVEEYVDDDDLFPRGPPVMEFTNHQEDTPKLQVPQLDIIEFADSTDPPTRPHFAKNYNTPNENFATFNRQGIKKQTEESSPSPSQFQLVKKDSQAKPKQLTKAQIKQQAKIQAESRPANDNVLIPIARGDRFELVPLSTLTPDQIVDYVQRQRRNEEVAQVNAQKQRRLQQQEQELAQRNRRLAQVQERRQSKEGELQRRLSKDIRSSVHKEIKEEVQDEDEEQPDDDYLSDFESASVSNSAIKSRISSRGNPKNNVSISKEEESVAEDEYSAEFDSYSQSALSRTNPNRNKANSISDLSESYRSISTSFRK